jgi:hypothetical protein
MVTIKFIDNGLLLLTLWILNSTTEEEIIAIKMKGEPIVAD